MSELEIEQGNDLGKLVSALSVSSVVQNNKINSNPGTVTGAGSVNVLVDGIMQGLASSGGGTWSINLDLAAGAHTLTANASDPSGLYTTTASSTFTVTSANPAEQTGNIASTYDADGNLTSLSWANGSSRALTWDAQNRLIKIAQRDSANNGYDWTAIYDGIGRLLSTTQQPVANNVANGAATVTTSIYDPQVEFLEIGVSVNGAKGYKIYGPDLNGRYGGLQGIGGLEATIVDSSGATKGILCDQFGNGVATISGGTVSWSLTKCGAYGPLPGIVPPALTDIPQLADVTNWQERRVEAPGIVYSGKRIYDLLTHRFLSCDPLGFAASTSLYEFAANDPVNNFDPDGRMPGVPANWYQTHARPTSNQPANIDWKAVGKFGVFAAGTATAAFGGLYIAGLYEAGSIGWGTAVVGTAALNGTLGAASNTATQLIDNGGHVSQIKGGQVAVSGFTGLVFGGVSGGIGVGVNLLKAGATNSAANMTAQAVDYEVSGALRTQFWQYGPVAPETATMNRLLNWYSTEIAQTTATASAQALALDISDKLGSPFGEYYTDQYLAALFGFESQDGDSQSGNTKKGCGN